MSTYFNYETLKFILHDVHLLDDLLKGERFKDIDSDMINILLDGVKDYCDKELFPIYREMDEKPAYFEDGKIHVHPKVGEVMTKFGEMGLIGGHFDEEYGGMQLPESAINAAYTIVSSANNNMAGYPGLTTGAAALITTFGSQELKNSYVEKMLTGQWAGTMCLTEPQAGSSLSDLTSSASANGDGSYNVKGQKIFISGGDHEFTENFIHLFLARVEGAPAGTKGISLLVVPKMKINDDGTLSPNNVKTIADFQKMGQQGYCTTHLAFGEDGTTQGWLLGEENRGLKYMFQMMNMARISVGRDATACSIAAYHASLQYANERVQGRKIKSSGKKDATNNPVKIIEHADVRRMLLFQKAVSEGALSLIHEASALYDRTYGADEDSKKNLNLLLELITPVAKTYPSEKGKDAVDKGLQILGGYGFCTDFILQQYYRDIRIMSIYEGTTGIQSLDLLGRKIPMEGGKSVQLLVAEFQKEMKRAKDHGNLSEYADKLDAGMKTIEGVLGKISGYAMEGEFEKYLADATPFMEMFSTLVIAWQWLKMANTAQDALSNNQLKYSKEFYESKIHTMKFFYKYELSKIEGIANIFNDDNFLTLQLEKELIL